MKSCSFVLGNKHALLCCTDLMISAKKNYARADESKNAFTSKKKKSLKMHDAYNFCRAGLYNTSTRYAQRRPAAIVHGTEKHIMYVLEN